MLGTDALAGARLVDGLPGPVVERLAAAMVPLHLSGGQWLFRQGDPGDSLFLLTGGRLEVVRTASSGEPVVVAQLRSGDTLGELALLQGGTRTAGARAVRDCDLLMLQRADFTPLLADPRFAVALLAQVTRMLRAEPVMPDPAGRRAVVAIVGADPRAVTDLVTRVARDLVGQGVTAAVLQESDVDVAADTWRGTSQVLDILEQQHDMVLLDGGDMSGPWSRTCARQADRVLVVADLGSDSPPSRHDHLRGGELVVIGDGRPSAGALDRWAAAIAPRAHHVLRPGHPDVGRLARRVAGRALGLVLSGGGARGMAHIGVLAALEEAGITIDRFGGTSMGAFVSALAATGRTAAEVESLAVRELGRRKPFADWTIPRTSLIRGVRAERMLQRVFGDLDVRQLARPWFAISADLVAAEKVVHRDGPIWEAVACSISLPGMAPPRLADGRVLVDGGVLDNLPVGVMADDGDGQVIAVDLSLQRDFAQPGRRPVVPRMVETLSVTMALANLQQVAANRRRARLVIDPDVAGVQLLDFDTMARSIEAGHAATTTAIRSAGDLMHPAPGR